MTANVRSHALLRGLLQFSQIPATPNGWPSRREIAYRLPALSFLKEAVRWDDATPLAVGVAEPLVLGDRFGPGMDRREIRTLPAEMRNQSPPQMALHRRPGLGIPAVNKLRFVRPSLLIHD